MLIQCPHCRAQARIPESKEGARVRCGDCGKLYTARDPGRRGSGGTQGTTIAIYLIAALLAASVFFVLRRQKQQPLVVAAPVAAQPGAAPVVDSTGWDSEPVAAARALFEAASALDEQRLARLLAPEGSGDGEGAGAPAARAAALVAPRPTPDPDAGEYGAGQGADPGDEAARLATGWKPFDGEVLEESDERARVRLQVAGREPETASETRQVDVRLVRSGQAWRVLDWARYRTPAELEELSRKAARAEREAAQPTRETLEVVRLSDGSEVTEAEPAPIPFPEDTPPELRRRIEAELARMIDLSLDPKEGDAARRALVELGAPALPALLTALYELPLETLEDAIRVNLVNQTLEEITGRHTGFEPQVQEGSGTGTSAERRESAIRQWFGWWYREGTRFEGREDEGADPLEGLIEPTERDLREMERQGGTRTGGSG